MLAQKLASLSGVVKPLNSHHTADKDLIDRDHTALPFRKTASHQSVFAHSKEPEKLLADNAVVKTEFSKFLAEM